MSIANKQRDAGPHPDAKNTVRRHSTDTTGINRPMTPARDMRERPPIPKERDKGSSDEQYKRLP